MRDGATATQPPSWGSSSGEAGGGSPSDFDPGALISAVDKGAERLEDAADAHYQAVKRFEKAEETFDRQMAELRLDADIKLADAKGKTPSQDRRQDWALRALYEHHEDLYLEYFAAKAEREAQQVLLRALTAAVSARQSLLRALTGGGG